MDEEEEEDQDDVSGFRAMLGFLPFYYVPAASDDNERQQYAAPYAFNPMPHGDLWVVPRCAAGPIDDHHIQHDDHIPVHDEHQNLAAADAQQLPLDLHDQSKDWDCCRGELQLLLDSILWPYSHVAPAAVK
ncbi:unnamed protein product [Sphagnum balticum]